MTVEISEAAFESDIEVALLAGGPDDTSHALEVREEPPHYGNGWPSGGFAKRDPKT